MKLTTVPTEEEQLELEDLKNKDELIEHIQGICKANKDNPYCSVYWLKDKIDEKFKLYGYY